ncbi:MAG: alanine--tRNA ligase [Pseudomonadota bacterium]|nr:alanine--tRNA ligase [Pseudomonadota bacterium]
MTSTNSIRTTFLEFFEKNSHEIVNSSPLVPQNDPTLMFTNAGMVQFKNVFTGLETRGYSRATTSQKCVRAGGKHNDLENVGYTARHHTFFEMLGNFSFGDYFKDQAIELAWKLVTQEFGISKERLYVTVYHEDEEAFDLWRKIAGLGTDRIIRINTSDNFWAMGDTGPCGPCSEIFYDHGEKISGGPPGSPDQDGDRFIEIWNLVFMQYEQVSLEERIELPKPSIDTGMGLERLSALLQGTHDNYETDTLRCLIEATAQIANVEPYGLHNVSNRVISDHLRAISFLIADGVLPSNEGRGYVLRRIMRRAMRHAHIMGCPEAILYRLIPELILQMGQAYPELARTEALITETLKAEETRFKQTLDRGLKLLSSETERLGEGQPLPGDVAFRLYDTYGFPIDLTEDVLRAKGQTVDILGFEAAMQQQRDEARKSWVGSGDNIEETIWFDIKEQCGVTEFLGYTTENAEGEILAIIKNGVQINTAKKGDKISVVTNQTPFYGESGGQLGDTGTVLGPQKSHLEVSATNKVLGDIHVHIGYLKGGKLSVGDSVELQVDVQKRSGLRKHHSATHLLHAALRNQLGDHVMQKGSLVASQRLRFDVSHPKAISSKELEKIAEEVNKQIDNNFEVITRLMVPEEAINTGAIALFGEKYGEEVRVITMGNTDVKPYSVELCGGTHVSFTGEIGSFKITSESAVAAGVRRIEAVTGRSALDHLLRMDNLLHEASKELNVAAELVPERIKLLLEDRKKLVAELADLRRKVALGGGDSLSGVTSKPKDIAGIPFLSCTLERVPPRELKAIADDLKKQIGSGVVAVCGINEGKASLVVGITEKLSTRIDAVTLVRAGSSVLGGKGGGGRADLAQAGGPDGSKAAEAFVAIENEISNTKKI